MHEGARLGGTGPVASDVLRRVGRGSCGGGRTVAAGRRDEAVREVRCPGCGADDDRVVDSRPSGDGDAIRRRRECRACGLRFTTFERVELPELSVRKRSGVTAPFTRTKVLDGMARAAKGRVDTTTLEAAAGAVERAVRALGTREVTSEQVGLQVLAQLRQLDDVAYVRFASVYKDFQGPEDFEQELSTLRKDAPPKPA